MAPFSYVSLSACGFCRPDPSRNETTIFLGGASGQNPRRNDSGAGNLLLGERDGAKPFAVGAGRRGRILTLRPLFSPSLTTKEWERLGERAVCFAKASRLVMLKG